MLVRYFLSLTLLFSIFTISVPQIGYAQTAGAQNSSNYAEQLAAIEERVEKRRQELGIPGMSLVIVKDGEIIFVKGFGYKDFEKKVAVTPDTQFAIGSATKAFTALGVLMSQDEGKLSLDDSPKKYLPYFKMKDPETDAKMTVRDLMAHNSGLNRTDLAMLTGKLTRQELIQVAGEAEPMAKFREKFFYNNIMYGAAGEITAVANKSTWEKFIPERIFKPLGMTNTNLSVGEMQKAKDFSFGYNYNFDTKETIRLPFRSIDDVGPAGSINSSARDMAKWITFAMNNGSINGKKLVSEKGFDEWTKPQMKVVPSGKISYGLGWFLQDWNGLKVVQHGGNIDGFNSMVAMIPEKKLGFVMLTNVSGSPLGNDLMPLIWGNILGNPDEPKTNSSPAVPAEKEVGIYKFEAAGFDIEVKLQEGKLSAVVPGQPVYELQNVGGRKYKLANAPDGFYITFKDDSAFLEQPQGNFTLPKAGSAAKTNISSAAKELVGVYSTPDGKGTIEIKSEAEGKVTLNIPGQQPYALTDKAKDEFNLSPLPPSYYLKTKRDAANAVSAIAIAQPEGEFEFKKTAKAVNQPKITLDELVAKAIEAAGGEANLRKITSRITVADIDIVHQGMKGTATSYAKSPNLSATETTMTALGKVVARGYDFFDGTNGEEAYTFAPAEKLSGKRLEDVKIAADLYSILDWRKNFKSIEVKGIEKVGGEECYAVEFTPEKGTKFIELYSASSFLLLKRNGMNVSSTSEIGQPYTIVYSDYRDVDGIKLAFKTVNTTAAMGDVVVVVKSVKHNTAIDPKVFGSRKLK